MCSPHSLPKQRRHERGAPTASPASRARASKHDTTRKDPHVSRDAPREPGEPPRRLRPPSPSASAPRRRWPRPRLRPSSGPTARPSPQRPRRSSRRLPASPRPAARPPAHRSSSVKPEPSQTDWTKVCGKDQNSRRGDLLHDPRLRLGPGPARPRGRGLRREGAAADPEDGPLPDAARPAAEAGHPLHASTRASRRPAPTRSASRTAASRKRRSRTTSSTP